MSEVVNGMRNPFAARALVSSILDAVPKNKGLEVLSLAHNALQEVPISVYQFLDKLKYLDLSDIGLRSDRCVAFAHHLKTASNLEVLKLGGNGGTRAEEVEGITALADGLVMLKNLKHFEISANTTGTALILQALSTRSTLLVLILHDCSFATVEAVNSLHRVAVSNPHLNTLDVGACAFTPSSFNKLCQGFVDLSRLGLAYKGLVLLTLTDDDLVANMKSGALATLIENIVLDAIVLPSLTEIQTDKLKETTTTQGQAGVLKAHLEMRGIELVYDVNAMETGSSLAVTSLADEEEDEEEGEGEGDDDDEL